MLMKLEGKIAIITGGSRGIGLGCARVFGRHGGTVVIASHDDAEGREAEAQLSSAGINAMFQHCDVRVEADILNLINITVDRFGRLDCILNNAGWHPPAATIDQIDLEAFQSLLQLNLTSTFLGCKYAVEHLKKTRGNIINMSSAVALMGQAGAASYVATKAGQIGLTRSLAIDLARDGVRVNAVCPAGVRTPLVEEWAQSEYSPEEALRKVDYWHPLGRMATVEEIGEVCAFLASHEASFITGQVISADGGAGLGYAEKFDG